MMEKIATKTGHRPILRGTLATVDDLMNEIEQLWQKPWLPFHRRRVDKEGMAWIPRIDVYQKDNEMVVKADLPGMKREDFQVYLEEGDLILKGERKEETQVEEERYYRAECHYGTFYRRLPLEFETSPEKISARFVDGVLEVHVPMAVAAKPAVKEIPVN